MTDPRTNKVEEIRALLERGEYSVDAAKVADAILARLLVGRSAKDAAE